MARALFALYCHDAQQRARTRSVLLECLDTVATGDWHQFEVAAADAECSVAVVEWLHDDLTFERLAAFRRRVPLHPLVLVTHKDADNARRLKGVSIEEVVWSDEMQKALGPAVSRVRARGLLCRLACALEGAAHLPTHLREALAQGCRCEPPARSVTGLAALVGCSRSTLWYHWHKVARCDPPLRLEDFLDWLLLLRVVGQKLPGRPWSAVATELGVHEHTLARIATRLVGVRLRDLEGNGQQMVAVRFNERVLNRVLAVGGGAFLRLILILCCGIPGTALA